MSDQVTIRRGGLADYDRLARFHYRAGRPATCVRVLVAEAGGAYVARSTRPEPVGVLVISMPALNGPWRERVWPGRYRAIEPTRDDRLACARAINEELRVISRVVVEPRWRGLGIGRRLVRAYLDDPLSVRTEAISAMARFSGVFEGAGMRAVDCPPSKRVCRLRNLLRELDIEPWRLSDPSGVERLCRSMRPSDRERLQRGLRSFAISHRDTRDRADGTLRELIAIAAVRVSCRPRAYVWSLEWESQARVDRRVG
jgi:GNAT superfamily N-acetyltransferase